MSALCADRGSPQAHPPGTNPSPLRPVDLDGHVVKARFGQFFGVDHLWLLEIEKLVEQVDKGEVNVLGVGDDEPGVCAEKCAEEMAAEMRLDGHDDVTLQVFHRHGVGDLDEVVFDLLEPVREDEERSRVRLLCCPILILLDLAIDPRGTPPPKRRKTAVATTDHASPETP